MVNVRGSVASLGHAIPGLAMILLGTWWLINIFSRYLHAKISKTATYTNSCFYATSRRVPIEPIMIAIFTTVQILIELSYVFPARLIAIANHITMCACFLLAGIIGFINHRTQIFPRCEYILLAFGVTVEGVTFLHHQHTADVDYLQPLESGIHWLLLLTSFGMALALLMEMYQRHNVFAGVTRAFLFVVHGLWYIFAGFALFMPPYNDWWAGCIQTDIRGTEQDLVTSLCVTGILGIFHATACLAVSHWLIRNKRGRNLDD